MKKYNNSAKDIRLNYCSKNDAINTIKMFVKNQNWIYIKSSTKELGNKSSNELCAHYNKFKTKSISEDFSTGFLYIYGSEDNDRLIISTSNIVQTEITPEKDEVLLILKCQNTVTTIYIKQFIPNKERIANSLLDINKNLIITEGKTDWKHLKSALSKLRSNGLYTDLDFEFFEYESSLSEGNPLIAKTYGGADTLDRICQYNALFHNEKIRIFVFDSDVKKIKKRYSNDTGYTYVGNNVYALVLPLPDSRKNTPEISIENYYSDAEIKTEDFDGKRLFLSNEFGYNNADNTEIYPYFSLKERKEIPNLVIDDEVYINCQQLIISSKDQLKQLIDLGKLIKTHTLSKNEFAENILNDVPPFNTFNIKNFIPFFDMITKIKEHSAIEKRKSNGLIAKKTLQKGIELDVYSNHEELNITYSTTIAQIQKQANQYWFNSIEIQQGKINFVLGSQNNPIYISIEITSDIILFLNKKRSSHNNRIYINFYDEHNNYILSREIFTGENGDIALGRLTF